MASTIGVIVSESRSTVGYDRSGSDVRNSGKGDFIFNIQSAGGGSEQAVLQIYFNGSLCREHRSEPFPAGAFKKKSSDLNSENFNVQFKKSGSYRLGDYFY